MPRTSHNEKCVYRNIEYTYMFGNKSKKKKEKKVQNVNDVLVPTYM